MSQEVIAAAMLWARSYSPDQKVLKVLWHAGEPLMAGLNFYTESFATIAKSLGPQVDVIHSMQTNATLVNATWARFLRDQRVQVGVSIDGPADVHDARRVNWAGRSTHQLAMNGVRALRAEGVSPGAICVLSRDSLGRPDDIYDFFLREGFGALAFNVDETEGSNRASSLLGHDDVRAAYKSFIGRVWQRWRDDGCAMTIREFGDELTCIRELQADDRFIRKPDEVVPFAIVTVNKDGNLSTFGPELASTASREYSDFILGNVLENTPEEIIESELYVRLAGDLETGRDNCRRSCDYFSLCGGGFQSNRIAEHGSLLATQTQTCLLHRKSLIDVVTDELVAESATVR